MVPPVYASVASLWTMVPLGVVLATWLVTDTVWDAPAARLNAGHLTRTPAPRAGARGVIPGKAGQEPGSRGFKPRQGRRGWCAEVGARGVISGAPARRSP